MKYRAIHDARHTARPPASKMLKLAVFAAALLAATVAAAEGGDPIGDQAGAVRAQRQAQAQGRQSDYEAAFARAHPGDPRNTVHGERAAGQYAGRSSHYSQSDRHRQNDRSYRYSEPGHRDHGHDYAYATPYFYDPAPSPGISLFFNF